jgi:putative Mn2+ efflux pump MntP
MVFDWSVFFQIVLIGISLAMDAFAVAICDGLSIVNLNNKRRIFIAVVFGLMQGIMPLIGYYIGSLFYEYIKNFDHWIAFALLALIGGKMLYDGIKGLVKPETCTPEQFKVSKVLFQGLATSIDALAIGITLNGIYMFTGSGFDWSNIYFEALIIIVITFVISLIGILLGGGITKLLRGKYSIAEIIGGAILIAIGTKILIEHLIMG